jgi:integrase
MTPIEAILRLRTVLRRDHKAWATEESYVHWLRHYMGALSEMPPTLTSEQKLEQFLSQLAVERKVSASTQNQAFNALLFFYKAVLGKTLQQVDALRVTRPAHLRHAPTVAETRALLLAVRNLGGYPTNLIARLLYGCGLRVSEPLNLRIKDPSDPEHSRSQRRKRPGRAPSRLPGGRTDSAEGSGPGRLAERPGE